jgi:hypothetical protein
LLLELLRAESAGNEEILVERSLGSAKKGELRVGTEESLLMPLLAFNIGIELAQMVVLGLLALLGAVLTWRFFDRRGYVLAASGVTFGCAVQMVVSRLS